MTRKPDLKDIHSIPGNKRHANQVLIYLVKQDKTWVLKPEYRLMWVHLHWIPNWNFHTQMRPFEKEDAHWLTVISWSAITGHTRLTAAFSNSIDNAAVASVLIQNLVISSHDLQPLISEVDWNSHQSNMEATIQREGILVKCPIKRSARWRILTSHEQHAQ
jgi:hypothetical protein